METPPIDLKPTPPQQSTTATLLITAAVFFGLGFVLAYLIFGTRGDEPNYSSVQSAVNATFVALTPPPTLPPTRVPFELTYTDHNPRLGPDAAPIKMVEFSDYQCPYCGYFHATTLQPLLDHYGDLVQFIYREYPIIGGQSSAEAGAAALCASQQGRYWEYAELIWENQASNQRVSISTELLASFAEQTELDMDAYNTCLEDETGLNLVIADYQAGVGFDIRATPTFFIDGERISGANPIEDFMDIIDAQLTRKGIQPPPRPSNN